MKKSLLVFAMLVAMTFALLPAGGNNVLAQNKQNNGQRNGNNGSNGGQGQRQNQSRDWNNGKKKANYGYKNYGQYRRTQVGNRRYRLVKRSYWDNGSRLTRLVRIFY